MAGGIYADGRCPKCNRKFVNNGRALVCPKHRKIQATKLIVKFGKTRKRFRYYDKADRFLNGLRYKKDEGSYDPKDYDAERPLAFEKLIDKWLEIKKEDVKKGMYKNLIGYVARAKAEFSGKNVKDIGYAELDDWIRKQKDIKAKTRHNVMNAMHDFWQWMRRRKTLTLAQMPEFPEINFTLGTRKTVTKEVQNAILDEVHKISWKINPRIYIGICWLRTYISVRPGELIKLLEKHIELSFGKGYLVFPEHKVDRYGNVKRVPLIDEDIWTLSDIPRGLPDLHFFRHINKRKGVQLGTPFGERYLYKWWIQACTNLGITGVDLYGGTRASSAMALRMEGCTPEEIKRSTMHTSNAAFERYYRIEADEVKAVYEKTRTGAKKDGGTKVEPPSAPSEPAKVLEFK